MIRVLLEALTSIAIVAGIGFTCLALDKPKPSEKIALRAVWGAR